MTNGVDKARRDAGVATSVATSSVPRKIIYLIAYRHSTDANRTVFDVSRLLFPRKKRKVVLKFKTLIKSCALAVLVGSSALAGEVNGTYRGQGPMGQVSIELQSDGNGQVHGVVHDKAGDHRVTAFLNGDNVDGTLEFDGSPARLM